MTLGERGAILCQEAPRTSRCIETRRRQGRVHGQRCVRKHLAPPGALRHPLTTGQRRCSPSLSSAVITIEVGRRYCRVRFCAGFPAEGWARMWGPSRGVGGPVVWSDPDASAGTIWWFRVSTAAVTAASGSATCRVLSAGAECPIFGQTTLELTSSAATSASLQRSTRRHQRRRGSSSRIWTLRHRNVSPRPGPCCSAWKFFRFAHVKMKEGRDAGRVRMNARP